MIKIDTTQFNYVKRYKMHNRFNTEQDIGFNSIDFDVSGFSGFVGGNSGYCAKLYDQSGNGNDATRASLSGQGEIMLNSINGKPSMYSTRQMLLNTILSLPGEFEIFTVYNSEGGGINPMVSSTSNTSSFILLDYYNGSYYQSAGDNTYYCGNQSIKNTHKLVNVKYSGGVLSLYQNGTLIPLPDSYGAGHEFNQLFNWLTLDYYRMYYFNELIIYNRALTTDERNAVNKNIKDYYNL